MALGRPRHGPLAAVNLGVLLKGQGDVEGTKRPTSRPSTPGTPTRRITTHFPNACGGWWPAGCCRSGPGSRSRRGCISRWPTCCCSTATPPCRSSGPRRSGNGGRRGGRSRPRPAARAAPGSTATPPRAVACDAAMAPLVTGDVNVAALEDLVRLCVELDRHRRDGDDRPGPGTPAPGTTAAGHHGGCGHHGGPGGAGAGGHRQGGGPAVRAGRAGGLLAPPAARRAAGRAEPAAGHRVLRVGPGRDPQRGDPAGPQVPVGRRLRPARVGVRRAPRQAQEATAARPASRTASCSVFSTTRS